MMDDLLLFPELTGSLSLQQHQAPKNPSPTANPSSYAKIVERNVKQVMSSEAFVYDDGESKSVRITQAAFDRRVELCNHSLIGRLICGKGDRPRKLEELKQTLTKAWRLTGKWRLISIGKGFYHVFLTSNEEKQSIWSRGTLSLKPGIFRLQPWSPDFDPNSQKTTNAQLWVRLYNLPWVYWDAQILSDIARCIGGLLRIDKATLEGDFGHYARMLIDVDMAASLPTSLGIEREGKKIRISVEYENVPDFCKLCSSIGHPVFKCKQNQTSRRDEDNKGFRKHKMQSLTITKPIMTAERADIVKEHGQDPVLSQRTPAGHRSKTPPRTKTHRSKSPLKEKQQPRGRNLEQRVWHVLKNRNFTVPVQQVVDRIIRDTETRTSSLQVSVIDPLATKGPDPRATEIVIDTQEAEREDPPQPDKQPNSQTWADQVEDENDGAWETVQRHKNWKQDARAKGASRSCEPSFQ